MNTNLFILHFTLSATRDTSTTLPRLHISAFNSDCHLHTVCIVHQVCNALHSSHFHCFNLKIHWDAYYQYNTLPKTYIVQLFCKTFILQSYKLTVIDRHQLTVDTIFKYCYIHILLYFPLSAMTTDIPICPPCPCLILPPSTQPSKLR